MDVLPLLCVVSVALTGLTKGAGVLPGGPLNAAVGGTVIFNTSVTLTEIPSFIIVWGFGDRPIITFNVNNITVPEYEGRITLFMSTGSLELRHLALNDTGEYRVNILPAGEGAMIGSTTLNVLEPVLGVTATPSSRDLVEFNSSVRLSCSVSSGSSLSFLWLNGSSEVTASDRVQLTDGGSNLTIVNVTRYDQGPFMCRVSNLVSGVFSDPVNLSISFGPENTNLTLSPSKPPYGEGSDIILSCSADSRPAALFKWFLNGDLQSTGPELRLMDIQKNQSGNYSCQAFNNKTERYETSQLAVVSVLERISGASVSSSTNLSIEGNSFNLTCDAAGSLLTRRWLKDGSAVNLADNIILYDEKRVLSFQPLKRKDSGEYSCYLSNPISTAEASYNMVVNYGPENVHITGPKQIDFDQNLTLTCSAESTPSATFIWSLNGTEIHNSPVFTKNTTVSSDNGNYICQSINNITGRTSSATHQLTITDLSDRGLSAGAIAGITIATCFMAGVGATGGFYIYKKKMKSKPQTHNTGKEEHVYENTSAIYENV